MPIIPRESLREKLRRYVLRYSEGSQLVTCHRVPGKPNLVVGMGRRYDDVYRVLAWWYAEDDEWKGLQPFDCLEEFCRDYRSKASADKYLRKLEAYLQDPDTTILHVKPADTGLKQRWKERTEHLDER